MMDTDRTAHNLFALTSEIAGRLVADGSTEHSAAQRARKVVAQLLGLESISFELEKNSRDEVSGIIVSYDLK